MGVEPDGPAELWARLRRFGLVGLTSTALYAVAALGLQAASVEPLPASLAAFAFCSVVSFVGHRWFTFRSTGRAGAEGARFAATTLLGFVLTTAIPLAGQALGAPGWASVLASCLIVPALNYLLLNSFVFARR